MHTVYAIYTFSHHVFDRKTNKDSKVELLKVPCWAPCSPSTVNSQSKWSQREYRSTFFWLFEDTPTRNHHFWSQNKSQQQKVTSGVPSFCLDRTQIYMKSEHLAEAKRNLRSRGLPTIINYKDTTTFNNNNNLKALEFKSWNEICRLRLLPHISEVTLFLYSHGHLPHPATQPYSVRTLHFVELRQERNSLL